jgi:cytidylate kinase
MPDHLVVVIDGPAGAGKSTVAKGLAKRLGVAFMDTGAMYRAITVKALREKVDLESETALVALAERSRIDLVNRPGKDLQVLLDGVDVAVDIRTLEVTNKTFYVARAPGVRRVMADLQRAMGERQSLVGDGRDLGTVVFPSATCKFYLDADFKVRCRRRIDEIRARGEEVDEEALAKDLAERDRNDLTRKVAPLRQAQDAILVDSTGMTVCEVVDLLERHVRERWL